MMVHRNPANRNIKNSMVCNPDLYKIRKARWIVKCYFLPNSRHLEAEKIIEPLNCYKRWRYSFGGILEICFPPSAAQGDEELGGVQKSLRFGS
jgi:hypothetical protein